MFTLFTRYPINIGLNPGVILPATPFGMPTNVTTLAEKLRSADYSTHMLGKWHLGLCKKAYWPTSRGFDHFNGFLEGTGDYYTHNFLNGYDYRADNEVDFAAEGTYDTTLIRDNAINVIKSHNQSSPLFLYLAPHGVHTPLQVDKSYQDIYSDIPDEDRQKYLGMVTALDEAVGGIIDSLKQSGMYENSIIVFLSDNGGVAGNWPPSMGGWDEFGASNWPLRGSKATIFEGGTRTVSFIHSPRYITPRVEQGMFHVTDWFPTLLSAAGLEHDDDIDGVDQWEKMKDSSLPEPRKEMLYNLRVRDMTRFGLDSWPPLSAIRVGDWKYIWRNFGYDGWMVPPEQGDAEPSEPVDLKHQLYNLALDPLEEDNLADIEPEVAEMLLNKLIGVYEGMGLYGNFSYPTQVADGMPDNNGGIWGDGWC